MKCRNCGREINETAAFCGYCKAIVKPEQRKIAVQQPAAPQPIITPPQNNTPPEDNTSIFRKWWFWSAVFVLLILVAGIVFFGLFGGDDKSDNDNVGNKTTTVVAVDETLTKPTAPAQINQPEVLTEVASMIHNGSFDNFEGDQGTATDPSLPYTTLDYDENVSIPGLIDFNIGSIFYSQELYNHYEVADEYSPFTDIEGETYIFVGGEMTNTSSQEIMPTYMHVDYILNGVSVSDTCFTEIYLSDAEQSRYYDVEYLQPGETRLFLFVVSVPDEIFEEVISCEVVFGFDNELSYEPYINGIDYCDYIYYVRTDEISAM